MSARRIFRGIRPYITPTAVIVIAVLLVGAIYFTELGKLWITFLSGILIASIIGMSSRSPAPSL